MQNHFGGDIVTLGIVSSPLPPYGCDMCEGDVWV